MHKVTKKGLTNLKIDFLKYNIIKLNKVLEEIY